MADTTAFGKDKGLTSKSMDMIKGGGSSNSGGGGYDSAEDSSNSGSGPTGSSRSYPKGGSKPADTQDAPFNPQKVSATDYRVGGV
jgi:hypothetical protein